MVFIWYKYGISYPVKNVNLSKKLATLVTKAESKAEQDKIMKLQTLDLNYFHCKSHFEDYGMQNFLVFQPVTLLYFTLWPLFMDEVQLPEG